MSKFTIAVSQDDDDSIIRRDGEILCRLPASELSELSDAILESLCGPSKWHEGPIPELLAQAALSGVKAETKCGCGLSTNICSSFTEGKMLKEFCMTRTPNSENTHCCHAAACHS